MQGKYKTTELRELRDQLTRFSPREKKLTQSAQAELLLRELDPTQQYSDEYLFFRITGFRPGTREVNTLISGDDAAHDLRLLIEDVYDAANIDVTDVPEPVRTVEQLAESFQVSTKTISRWREQGLTSRRFLVDGRKRVGFLQNSIDYFIQHNRNRIERGARFSQLTDEERDEIIHLARRLARAAPVLRT